MIENILNEQQAVVTTYVKDLREKIIQAFADLDSSLPFVRTPWLYKQGQGGGEMAVIRGRHFEKAAVNWSGIFGDKFPMDDASGKFYATGVSLITHMANPHAPTVHCNLRYIETEKMWWFGGGFDLTPMGIFYDDDTAHFHGITKDCLDAIDKNLYPHLSAAASTYFFIPHRKKERGVGGIFFDHVNSGDFNRDYQMWRAIGDVFLQTILPIYRRRIDLPFTEDQRQLQLEWRAHYVEFNLLYDRGTKFGFLSGGNPEAILCSLPPLARW